MPERLDADDEAAFTRVIVGFTESASFSPIVASVMTRFRQSWPNVMLVLEEDLSETLAGAVEQGRLDLAFVRPPIRTPNQLSIDALGDEPMVVAMPREHRFAQRSSVKLRELAAEDFVLRRRTTGLQAAILSACREEGFSPRITQQAPQLSTIINLVAASMGVAIVPECMNSVRPERVVFVAISDLGVRAQLGLLRKKGGSHVVQRFMEVARSASHQSPPRGRSGGSAK
ncbi:LysR substrate-binding domain-containing protein [Bradyrhizobium arachidis]|uniref:LysR substrate-binding domain-containing protein n=1 Tax=Bradyrhizobium arachidis TaxID=858423 RepID=A0AAE7P082_9BRAD|nr:LysR substrate-binding domain-containing protein [Bradyrhizobium arachidis]QOZ73715.1 hypothetical protein WN72_33570 [Bradyrhizobium arachidis]SFV19220.1 DNA-binding transcriptional regulator, LysR family [Bradyrhizobium arachidis]